MLYKSRQSGVQIKSNAELDRMRTAGRLASECLDDLQMDFAKRHGVVPAPLNYRGFPKSVCTSVNEVICHGIPSSTHVLEDGDIIGVDVTLIVDGFYGDNAATVPVGEVGEDVKRFLDSTLEALRCAIEAVRIATEYMTPVFLLTDGFIANGAEPWRLPKVEDLPKFPKEFRTEAENYQPYSRDEKGARPWVKPGTRDMAHRVGGIEKAHLTGNISYDPDPRAPREGDGDRKFDPDPSCQGGAVWEAPRPRVGFHLWLDRGRGRTHERGRRQGRSNAPAARLATPERARGDLLKIRVDPHTRDEPRAARAPLAQRVPEAQLPFLLQGPRPTVQGL